MPDGDLLLLLVDGCDSEIARGSGQPMAPPWKKSLRFLKAEGALEALNLSGEGSSHLFIAGGLANLPSARRGTPGVIYERMLPSIGIVD